MTRTTRFAATITSLAVGVTLAAMAGAPPGVTASPRHHGPDGAERQEVASGLDNPRQLSFDGRRLYVAEAGTGGTEPCFEGPEGETCFGNTGAITVIDRRGQRRVVAGLPSLAGPDGSSAIGPSDVLVDDGRWTLAMGLGADPAVRSTLPSQQFGTLLAGKLHRKHRWAPRVVADLAAHEAATDPDGAGPDSNPTALVEAPKHRRSLRHGSKHRRHHHRTAYVVVDAGGNSLVAVSRSGRTTTLATFDSPGTAPLPFPPFDEVPMQAVPTSVAEGPDGAWYVSELVGFPFAPGASRIHRVTADGTASVWATGLTNVTDLAWHGRHLYAVQLSDVGLANEEALPMGSLVKVRRGGATQTVADGLPAPYGVALRGHAAYVTTCAVCADGGSVVRIPLS